MGYVSLDVIHGLIVLRLRVEAIDGDSFRNVRVALDTAASTTAIPTEVAMDLGYDLVNPKEEVDVVTGSGIELMKRITVRKLTAIQETIEDIDVLCHDLPADSVVDGVLGLNFLQHFDINISFSTRTIELQRY